MRVTHGARENAKQPSQQVWFKITGITITGITITGITITGITITGITITGITITGITITGITITGITITGITITGSITIIDYIPPYTHCISFNNYASKTSLTVNVGKEGIECTQKRITLAATPFSNSTHTLVHI